MSRETHNGRQGGGNAVDEILKDFLFQAVVTVSGDEVDPIDGMEELMRETKQLLREEFINERS